MAEQEPPIEPLDGLPSTPIDGPPNELQEPPEPPEPVATERQTVRLRRRWTASAPVPSPAPRARRKLFRLRPPTETGEDDTVREHTLDLPAEELAAMLREPAPPEPAPRLPVPREPAPHEPAPHEPAPHEPAPRPPVPRAPTRRRQPPAAPGPPVLAPPAQAHRWTPPPGWVPGGWVPPPGWVAIRRRRRWPWVLLVIGLVTVACCCGVPALIAKPFFDEYPASVSLPAQAAGLVRVDDQDSRRLTADLKRRVQAEYLITDDVFAAVYTQPETSGNNVTLLGAARFIFDPGKDLRSALGKLSKLSVSDVRSADAGPLGGELSCGRGGGAATAVCGWADHGSIGVAIFPERSTEESAQLLRRLRAAVVTRS
jgi:hypothetical protein